MVFVQNGFRYKTPTADGHKPLGDSGYNWWRFPLLTQEEAQEFCRQNDISAHYAGPGGNFARRPIIRHSLTRTLITQYVGRDI